MQDWVYLDWGLILIKIPSSVLPMRAARCWESHERTKLKNKYTFLKKYTNWAKLNSLILTEREETKIRYFAPSTLHLFFIIVGSCWWSCWHRSEEEQCQVLCLLHQRIRFWNHRSRPSIFLLSYNRTTVQCIISDLLQIFQPMQCQYSPACAVLLLVRRSISYDRMMIWRKKTRWSWLLVPTFDMGSDVATAVTHYKWGNYG